jgi:hypothetical protein
MSKNGFLITLLASIATLGLGGCSIQNTPHSPSFTHDIQPILASRCIRCHGAGSSLNHDPDTTNKGFGQPYDGYFDRIEDDCPDGKPIMCHGFGHYTSDPGKTVLLNYIHNRGGVMSPMPPAPAPRLTSEQLDIFDVWYANGAPLD